MGQYLSNKLRLEGIYKIQRKIVRIAKFSKFTQDTSPIFLFLLNLLTIYELNSYLLALFMYTYFRWQLPPSFSDYFSENNTIHSVIQGPRTKYTLSMKELIIDVSQLDIEVLWYGTVCRIVWRKLSHCSCLKENWNVFSAEIYWLHIVEHI